MACAQAKPKLTFFGPNLAENTMYVEGTAAPDWVIADGTSQNHRGSLV